MNETQKPKKEPRYIKMPETEYKKLKNYRKRLIMVKELISAAMKYLKRL
jgi:hypothetical protein